MAGRPSLLTTQRRDDLTILLAYGVPVGVAARSVDVSPRTLRRWLNEGDHDLRERVAEVRDAERTPADDATAEARLVVLILRAAEHDWRASAWWLERRFPERWSGQRGGRPDHLGGRGVLGAFHAELDSDGGARLASLGLVAGTPLPRAVGAAHPRPTVTLR